MRTRNASAAPVIGYPIGNHPCAIDAGWDFCIEFDEDISDATVSTLFICWRPLTNIAACKIKYAHRLILLMFGSVACAAYTCMPFKTYIMFDPHNKKAYACDVLRVHRLNIAKIPHATQNTYTHTHTFYLISDALYLYAYVTYDVMLTLFTGTSSNKGDLRTRTQHRRMRL